MYSNFRKLLSDIGETFWLVPAVLVIVGIIISQVTIQIDQSGIITPELLKRSALYDGGGTGARTLLGAIASSSIGVAGTVFSITIAALSLAAGQMGPRLLRNFTRDRGNQITLGVFLGTFANSLLVLRSVRTQDEGVFVPHLSLTFTMGLALLCVVTLVYFVGHMASRINVDTVIALVSADVGSAIERLTTRESQLDRPAEAFWQNSIKVADDRRGYLQQLDEDALASWACRNGVAIRLLVRPGDFVFPGAPIALVKPGHVDAGDAIVSATALGSQRISSDDLEYAIRQLVEVAVRALSPGINDPHTAIAALDRLGAALCDLSGLHLPNGVHGKDGAVWLMVPRVDYQGVVDAMFHMIRQNGAGNPAILIRILEVLAAVASCEPCASRRRILLAHGELAMADAERTIENPSDLGDVRSRHASLQRAVEDVPVRSA